MIKIVLGGDVCPIGAVQRAFQGGDACAVFHDLVKEIADADLSVVNLECPLVSRETPIAKAGPVLGAPPDCIRGFAAAKWTALNLANNHSYDHGSAGLQETLQTIRSAGLDVVGAGPTIAEAQSPLIRVINGHRVVLYSMAEREFSVAGPNMPGANPLDLINLVYAIRQYKQGGTFIVLLHGGKEYYPYPSPEMVRRCRFMVEMGADAVVCCHTHCPLPWETHAGRPIVYGMGNLVFEPLRSPPAGFHEGYLVGLSIDAGRIQCETIPYLQSQGFVGARKMDAESQGRFLTEMASRNATLQDAALLKEQWTINCQRHREACLVGLFGYNRWMQKGRQWLFNRLYSRRQLLCALHWVQCETLREMLETIFEGERKRG